MAVVEAQPGQEAEETQQGSCASRAGWERRNSEARGAGGPAMACDEDSSGQRPVDGLEGNKSRGGEDERSRGQTSALDSDPTRPEGRGSRPSSRRLTMRRTARGSLGRGHVRRCRLADPRFQTVRLFCPKLGRGGCAR